MAFTAFDRLHPATLNPAFFEDALGFDPEPMTHPSHEQLMQAAFEDIEAGIGKIEWLRKRGVFLTSPYDDATTLIFMELDQMDEIELLNL